MIRPGAVIRHGRLQGLASRKNLVRTVQGYLYFGTGTMPPPEVEKPKPKYMVVPTRHRSRFPTEDDVLRDDDEILLIINSYIKTQQFNHT